MYHLYILKSLYKKHTYIGVTADVLHRLGQHNRGEVRSTKAYRPWSVIYTENFRYKYEALKREHTLKHHSQTKEELYRKIGLL